MFPNIVYAAPPDTLDSFLGRVSTYILNPVIGLIFAVAFAYFIWGVLSFIMHADNDTERTTGQRHMIWGVIGMFIMVAAYGIIGIITGTFGEPHPFPRS